MQPRLLHRCLETGATVTGFFFGGKTAAHPLGITRRGIRLFDAGRAKLETVPLRVDLG